MIRIVWAFKVHDDIAAGLDMRQGMREGRSTSISSGYALDPRDTATATATGEVRMGWLIRLCLGLLEVRPAIFLGAWMGVVAGFVFGVKCRCTGVSKVRSCG